MGDIAKDIIIELFKQRYKKDSEGNKTGLLDKRSKKRIMTEICEMGFDLADIAEKVKKERNNK